MIKVILISGKARHGKDQTAQYFKEILEENGMKCLICHYADVLKHFMQDYLGWNGVKDEEGRSLLQYWGTQVFRKNNPDCWVNIMVELLKGIEDRSYYVIIPDTRFKNEIEKIKEADFRAITVRVERPNFDNQLTEEQKRHPSEVDLDDYDFDYYIDNDKGLEELKKQVRRIIFFGG